MTTGIIRVGISGWTYAPWRGVFYPKGLKREHELEYAASHFRAIEINGTFYGMQRPDTFARWAEQVPANFVFPSRRRASSPTSGGCATSRCHWRISWPRACCGWVSIWDRSFGSFRRISVSTRLGSNRSCSILPHDTEAAAALGRKHDDKLRAPAWLEAGTDRPLRHAIEIRHESFRCQEFIELLRAHDMALVCADSVEWPRLMDVTSDFIYCRLHGSEELYASGYDNAALDEWARRIRPGQPARRPEDAERVGGKARRRKRDVFIFFDNDMKVRAPANAMELIRRLRA